MPLTSSQKHYLKKNWQKKTSYEMARELGLSEKEIKKHLKKLIGPEKFKKISAEKMLPGLSKGHETSSPDQEGIHDFVAKNINIFLLLFLLVLIAYFNAITNKFVSDDISSIVNVPQIGSWSYIFSGGPVYGFIQRILYSMDHSICGLNPACFRLNNLFFHTGNTFLIFILLSSFFKKPIPLIASILFAIHPIMTESISWISGLPYPQYSFFFLLSFLCYIRSKDNKKLYYYSLALFALSLISSEKAVVLFLVFALYEFVFNDKREWKKVIPYFAVCVTAGLVYVGMIGYRLQAVESQNYSSSQGFMNPFQQIPIAISSYFKLIFWPQKLSIYQTEMNFTIGQFILFVLGFLLFISLIIYSYKRNRNIFFWLVFFLITLLPTLTPVKIAWVFAERYAYLGAIGIFVVLAMFFDYVIRQDPRKKYAVYSFLGVIVIALMVRVIIRNIDWKDEDHLWPATLKVAPSGPNIHNNMGDVYARAGNFEKAIEEFKKSTELNPNYGDAFHNLGNTYEAVQDYPDAMQSYKKAISLNPRLWQSYQNMATIYFDQGDYVSAEENIKKALEINPTDQNLQNNFQIIEQKLQQK